MLGKLFITNVAVTKPIPKDDYIASLPTMRNLRIIMDPRNRARYRKSIVNVV